LNDIQKTIVTIHRKAILPIDFESDVEIINQGFVLDEFHIATTKQEAFQSPTSFTVHFNNKHSEAAYVMWFDVHNELLILRLENSIKEFMAQKSIIAYTLVNFRKSTMEKLNIATTDMFFVREFVDNSSDRDDGLQVSKVRASDTNVNVST